MTTNYQDDINETYNDLKEAGIQMVVFKSKTVENPDGSGDTTTVTSQESSYGIFKYKDVLAAGESYINGTLFEASDKFIMLASKTITDRPDPGDKIFIQNADGDTVETYQIKGSNPLEPDGVPIYYMLHVGS